MHLLISFISSFQIYTESFLRTYFKRIVLVGMFGVFFTHNLETPSHSSEHSSLYEIIIDTSQSMQDRLSGVRKIEMALTALQNVALGASKQSQIFVRKVGSVDDGICKPGPHTEILSRQMLNDYLFDALNQSSGGKTPLAASLIAAANDVRKLPPKNKHIILITDGVDTCGGNPIEATGVIAEMGLDIKVHVVGIQLDGVKSKYMKAVARRSEGEYFDVEDERGLLDSLNSIVVAAKPKPDGETIFLGGETLTTATNIHTADFLISAGIEETYFFIATKFAQAIILNIENYLVDVSYYDIEGNRVLSHQDQLVDTEGAGFFISIRSKGVKREVVRGKVVEHFDKNIGQESSAQKPLELSSNQVVVGHIGAQDSSDVYIFSQNDFLPRDSVVSIQLSQSIHYRLLVLDRLGREVLRKTSSEVSSTITLPNSLEPHTLHINVGQETQIVQYQIEWKVI